MQLLNISWLKASLPPCSLYGKSYVSRCERGKEGVSVSRDNMIKEGGNEGREIWSIYYHLWQTVLSGSCHALPSICPEFQYCLHLNPSTTHLWGISDVTMHSLLINIIIMTLITSEITPCKYLGATMWPILNVLRPPFWLSFSSLFPLPSLMHTRTFDMTKRYWDIKCHRHNKWLYCTNQLLWCDIDVLILLFCDPHWYSESGRESRREIRLQYAAKSTLNSLTHNDVLNSHTATCLMIWFTPPPSLSSSPPSWWRPLTLSTVVHHCPQCLEMHLVYLLLTTTTLFSIKQLNHTSL